MYWKMTPAWNRARYRALARLREQHRLEYDGLMREELKKEGLPRGPKTAEEEIREMYGI